MAEKLGIGREFVLKFVGKEKLTSVDFVDTFRYFDKDSKFTGRHFVSEIKAFLLKYLLISNRQWIH